MLVQFDKTSSSEISSSSEADGVSCNAYQEASLGLGMCRVHTLVSIHKTGF